MPLSKNAQSSCLAVARGRSLEPYLACTTKLAQIGAMSLSDYKRYDFTLYSAVSGPLGQSKRPTLRPLADLFIPTPTRRLWQAITPLQLHLYYVKNSHSSPALHIQEHLGWLPSCPTTCRHSVEDPSTCRQQMRAKQRL